MKSFFSHYTIKTIDQQPDNIIISRWDYDRGNKDKAGNSKPTIKYGLFKNNEISRLLTKNNYIFEVINTYPHKAYFDIEFKRDSKNELTDLEDYNIFKSQLLKFFIKANFSISGSIEDNKISFHIIINNYLVNNEEDKLILKEISKFLNYDPAVYGRTTQQFKLPNQKKAPNRKPQAILEDNNLDNHIIGYINMPIDYYNVINIDNVDFIKNLNTEVKEEILEKVKIKRLSNSKLDLLKYQKMIESDKEILLNNVFNYPTPDMEILPIILKSLPLDKNYGHDYTLLIMRLYQSIGLTENEYLEWYNKKHNNKEKLLIKKAEYRRALTLKKLDMWTIYELLRGLYDFINKKIKLDRFDKIYDIKKYMFNNEIINLSIDDFKTDKQAILFKLPMGSGKTQQTALFINEFIEDYENKNKNPSRILFISHSKNLIKNTAQRLKEAGNNGIRGFDSEFIKNNEGNIKKLTNLLSFKRYDTIQNKGELDSVNKLLICINSIEYLTVGNYDLIIIDEVENVLNNAVNIEFLKKNRRKDGKINYDDRTDEEIIKVHFKKLTDFLKKTSKLIFLDAFISNKTISILNNNDIQFDLKFKNNISTMKAYELNKNEMINNLLIDLNNNKKTILFYPYVNKENIDKVRTPSNPFISINQLKYDIENTMLQKFNKKIKILTHFSDNKNNELLLNINEEWAKYDMIISNTAITCGVNYDNTDVKFHNIYLFSACFNNANQIIQFSRRARHITGHIFYHHLKNNTNFNAVKPILTNDKSFNDLLNMIFYEQDINNIDALDYYLKMAGFDNIKKIRSNEDKNINYDKLILSDVLFVDFDRIIIEDDDNYNNLVQKKLELGNMFNEDDNLKLLKLQFLSIFKNKDKAINEIWNKGYSRLFIKLFKIFNNNDNKQIYTSIKSTFNKLLQNSFEITDKDKKEFVNMYNDNLITSNNKPERIIYKFLNTYIGADIIIKKIDKSRHITYSINPIIQHINNLEINKNIECEDLLEQNKEIHSPDSIIEEIKQSNNKINKIKNLNNLDNNKLLKIKKIIKEKEVLEVAPSKALTIKPLNPIFEMNFS